MKSLMEEASSIAKAVEQGWERAGKPKEFTVRIYEEPEKNFIGFTKRPAKVAIFFQEVAPEPSRMKEINRLVERREAERASKTSQPVVRRPEKEKRPAPVPSRPLQMPQPQAQPQTPKPQVDRWTPELIQKAKDWIDMILKRSDKAAIQYTLNAKNYALAIKFSQPLFEDNRREQLFFKSIAPLLMQSLKTQEKKGLKGYKVIILS